ncbi:hypothetical protein M422DRAFT_53033 [Sphaerobolus stellatus SS14]|uniref:Unplaced genomic scaffold SPHSTscaffold_156, whole genome shotgun sequence n=1 Tax=Sphaerobolus stellatus (strain SS14) TaxID=990650 RepID=A0A0C9V3Y8_SPHS4|nr:hypothetical protein M422DRAFT_53033 [Sphaerobolus stellatus SS14]
MAYAYPSPTRSYYRSDLPPPAPAQRYIPLPPDDINYIPPTPPTTPPPRTPSMGLPHRIFSNLQYNLAIDPRTINVPNEPALSPSTTMLTILCPSTGDTIYLQQGHPLTVRDVLLGLYRHFRNPANQSSPTRRIDYLGGRTVVARLTPTERRNVWSMSL